MALRGVWIIREAKERGVLFSRRWPTVEKRAKIALSSRYSAIPSDSDLCAAILVQCSQSSSNFNKCRDSCCEDQSYPVYSLFDELWPVVCIQVDDVFFVTIPLVDSLTKDSTTSMESATLGSAMQVLDGVVKVLGDEINTVDEHSSKIGDVYQFLSVCLPFGTILEVDSFYTPYLINAAKMAKSTPSPRVKKAAWQLNSYRGASKLTLTISEEIKAFQYDKTDISDSCDVTGILQCKADLEGYPDILLTLSTPMDSPALDYLVTHPCTLTSDCAPTRQENSDLRQRKLRFSAPIATSFTLAHYKWSSLSFLPIRGFYQMKGDKVVKLLIQLKLHESVRNAFDYFLVHIPVFNRGPIEKVDNILPVTLSSSLALSQDRKIIIWTIGQKFPSKGLELSLQASVHFYDHPTNESSSSTVDSAFCVGLNSYIDLFFKTSDFTISNCDIDPKSITLFPSLKCRLLINREVYSSQYRIWNSHGDAMYMWSQIK